MAPLHRLVYVTTVYMDPQKPPVAAAHRRFIALPATRSSLTRALASPTLAAPSRSPRVVDGSTPAHMVQHHELRQQGGSP
eukprot:CAMPEP_0118938232 /NCGR_PEP_ID=MMETSP1169-20130426/25213_1 /TAXON_ID=36882 /ORGANISM="Pyramimonas obovata, Strain CCMP722" /LENGTH=79 /DNA_ID=CAMNT_0006882115 /DNA_START=9 /DNA_END=245 /DNA_ORIENTATION=-